ncbi:MLLT4 family protein [Megaselia abdita]
MSSNHDKRMLDREAVRSVIQQWNTNRLDLFALSEPDENLLFHGVMRFYFQDAGQKIATKCIRVASDATVSDVIETLIQKFRPDMRMLSVPNYALYEVHANGEERRLNQDEKPLLVQLNWHIDDREGRFLLKNIDQKTTPLDNNELNFKRKLSKREKKEQKKKEKLAKLNSDVVSGGGSILTNSSGDADNHVAERLYTELPETSFTRSISNPEAVMKRRRAQKLEKKLQQFRSKDGGPDTGGTLKIYGESLCQDVPYKTLLLSIRDCAQAVVREMLAKYGLDKVDPLLYCLVQVNSDGTEYILDDDECPLSILMNHPTSRGSIMFHVRRRPADSQPRRRKKKTFGSSNGASHSSAEREGPMLIEVTHTGDGGRRIKLSSEPIEVGSANTNSLQLFGPSIQPRHCLISLVEGVCTVTPLHADALTFVNGHHIGQPTILHNGSVVMFGRVASYRFMDSPMDGRYNLALSQSQLDSACLYERLQKYPIEIQQGQEPILPAVLEFPETYQDNFLRQVIIDLDVNAPVFKLAPVYSLYLCARYRASTHYRPELQPTERAHKLTIFLHHVASLIHSTVQDQFTDPRILAFWMANSSEFLHFLKSDRHISAFSIQAQEVLAESVQTAFRNLVNCFRMELSQTLNQFISETIDHDSAAGLVLTVLGSVMALLRRCRVNAALTIQLFSQLFHYINVICFNTIVTNSHMCTAEWGKVMTERLQLLETWAERQGLELAADCHLAKINQCAQFLQAPKNSVDEIHQLACSCFRLNSLQMSALLPEENFSRNLIDTAVRMAQSVADELTRADGREIRLEESTELQLPLLLPDDGFSCDVVRGIPSGLVDFLNPLQAAGMCRLAAQPSSIGLWTVYMHQFNTRSPSAMSNKLSPPEVQIIKLHKNANGMGLSIVAAKGAGQERLGIYIKSVVPGGAADADGRLQAGDQLLRVDGQSLIGITQERAADYLVRTDAVVTLEVAKQGAIYHGLAKLLQQPSPLMQRGIRRMSDRDLNKPVGPLIASTNLPNSKSVPALHHNPGSNIAMSNSKSRSTHSLAAASNAINNNDQGFYQNLSVYRAQNQNQPVLSERPPMPPHTMMNLSSGNLLVTAPHQQQSPLQQSHMPNSLNQSMPNQRPASSYYQTNNANFPNQHHHISASSTNLNGMGQQQQQQMHPQSSMTMGNRGGKLSQQNLRMNPMMAPSMPNIAGGSNVGPSMGITSSQSMLNVNEHSLYPNNNQMMDQYHHNQPTPAQIRGHGKMMEMGEMMRRNQQRQEMDQAQMNLLNIPPKQQSMMHSPVKHMAPPATAPKPSKEDMPPLPPTSTHPLYKGSPITGNGGINYVASTLDPPKAAYYPINAGQSQKNYIAGNPWEREEREKEHEMRREHIRQWRDQQISELSTTQNRSSQQEEQLKTLVLERDFERRAQETEEGDEEVELSSRHEVIRLSNSIQTPVTTMKITEEDNNNSLPVADSQQAYQGYPIQQSQIVPTPASTVQPKSILKNNRYDNANLSNQSYPSSPSKSQKSTSFADELHPPISVTATTTSSTSVNQLTRDINSMELNEDNHSTPPPPPPPERNSSYLIMSQQQKMRNSLPNNNVANNVGTGINNSKGTNASGSEMNKRITLMTNNNVTNNNMLMTTTTNNNNGNGNGNSNNIGPANLHSPNTAMSAFRDNKRVSFHDEENNKYISSAATSPGSMGDLYHPDRMDFEMVREDPNRFIQETTAILQSPTSPEADVWNANVQSTPGVIGAQEVYRDPRTRRLAEAQQKQQHQKNEAVPEKLSFKEKMKMFALESGGDQTPKDKLKISRAQRDIDAVH